MPPVYCPFCRGDANIMHVALPDFEYGVPVQVDFCRCTACGLLFQSPAPAREQLQSFYPADYSHHAGGSNGTATLLGRLKDIQTKRLVRKCMPFLGGPNSKILEVGCGTGRFLLALHKEGYHQLTGIDQADAMGQDGKDKIRFMKGSIEDSLELASSYDAIVMHSVIEHFVDPAHVLRICAGLLAPGGRLILRTPNTGALCYRVFGRFWAGLQAPRHTWIFNRTNLERIARAAGFGRASWIRINDASAWPLSFQNLLVSLHLTSIPRGGVAWYSLVTLPFWYPIAMIETFLGRSSTLFCALVKDQAL